MGPGTQRDERERKRVRPVRRVVDFGSDGAVGGQDPEHEVHVVLFGGNARELARGNRERDHVAPPGFEGSFEARRRLEPLLGARGSARPHGQNDEEQVS